MPASRGVNPLATSHAVEHLSGLCLNSWSHDKPILYLINECLNKIDIACIPDNNQKTFFNTAKKVIYFRLYFGYIEVGTNTLKFYFTPILATRA